MFRIPSFYQMDMSFETAKSVFAGDILKGMEQIQDEKQQAMQQQMMAQQAMQPVQMMVHCTNC